MADERLEDGREIIPLTASSPVDPRVHLPDDQRNNATRVLANGTVVKDYRNPPITADEYSANLPDPDEYEAMIEAVIAEVDAEEEDGRQEATAKAVAKRQVPTDPLRHPRADWDPAPINRLGIWARKKKREAEEGAKEAAEEASVPAEGSADEDPWARLNDAL